MLSAGLFACDVDGPNDAGVVDRTVYPEGPFGVTEGSTIDNLDFVTSEGEAFDLNMIHSDENKKLLLITTSAGWCSACIEEQPFLKETYENNVARGLEVVVTVFEDDQFQPADVELAADWKETHDLPFDVLADADQKFADYYDTALTPMNMFVDLDTMEIIKIGVGADRSLIESIVSSRLP